MIGTTKRTFVAGVTALALLATPVGITAQWCDHGPKISAAPAVSTVHAAESRPTSTKPPSKSGPTFTSSGTAKATGYQTRPGTGRFTDDDCQAVAETVEQYIDNFVEAGATGNVNSAIEWRELAEATASAGLDQGCALSGTGIE